MKKVGRQTISRYFNLSRSPVADFHYRYCVSKTKIFAFRFVSVTCAEENEQNPFIMSVYKKIKNS